MNGYSLRYQKNKIFAVTLSAISVFCFILAYVLYGVGFGFNYLIGSPITIINILLTLVILVMLLVTNIQNDNRAFGAIMMLVFLVVWDLIVAWIPGGSGLYVVFNGNPGLITLGVFLMLSMVATVAFGILTFVFLFRYRLGRISFERQMLFSRLFVASLVVELSLEIATILCVSEFNGYAFAFSLLTNLTLAAAGVACLFTLRRLRR